MMELHNVDAAKYRGHIKVGNTTHDRVSFISLPYGIRSICSVRCDGLARHCCWAGAGCGPIVGAVRGHHRIRILTARHYDDGERVGPRKDAKLAGQPHFIAFPFEHGLEHEEHALCLRALGDAGDTTRTTQTRIVNTQTT